MARSLTDEAKEIVRTYMGDGKTATRKEIGKQVEDNISRPNEYRVNILNGVIKTLVENKELEVVERGTYQLGKAAGKLSSEQLVERYLSACKGNLERMCVYNMATATEGERQMAERVSRIVKVLDGVLVQFKGAVPTEKVEMEPEKKAAPADKAEGKPEKKAAPAEKVEVKPEKKAAPADKAEGKPEKKAAPADKAEVKPEKKELLVKWGKDTPQGKAEGKIPNTKNPEKAAGNVKAS